MISTIMFPLLACLGLVLALALLPGLRDRALPGRGWMLVRALFPSWRFFEELGQVPMLRYRVSDGEQGGWSEWKAALPPVPRGLGSLFLNARGNLRMASNSLVEQLVSDLAEVDDTDEGLRRFEASVSYELVTRLVRARIRALEPDAHAGRFQFKVVVATPGAAEGTGEEILVSSEHRIPGEGRDAGEGRKWPAGP
jgi:hypothetical protein